MNSALLAYFRCPPQLAQLEASDNLSPDEGFFSFGAGTVCYGRCAGGRPAPTLREPLVDVSRAADYGGGRVRLPFDFSAVIDNLRLERYTPHSRGSMEAITGGKASRRVYYFLRPLLIVSVRKHLQRIRLNGWDRIPFPKWPVDLTVETLMEQALRLLLKSGQSARIPFIWFWPDGAPACSIMTHDVEGPLGLDFCSALMDIDDAFGIKSAFQIVPEVRYDAANRLDMFRSRGFEVNVHDLSHDGALFQERQEFLRRASRINDYARQFGSTGFRAGAMYRDQDWYDAFEFSYDMSVPNVAHLEPQRGGCCTVMPYFIGNILELPLTTIQDYALFNIVRDYSLDIWKKQTQMIRDRHGLVSFITHPDYLIEERAQTVYRDWLGYLAQIRASGQLWIALPGEVDRWWRQRHEMRLVADGQSWRIAGEGSERATIAYASLEDDRVAYTFEGSAPRSAAIPIPIPFSMSASQKRGNGTDGESV